MIQVKIFILVIITIILLFLIGFFLYQNTPSKFENHTMFACGVAYTFQGETPLLTSEEILTFESNPECHHWSVFILAAATYFSKEETRDLAVFNYYVGQLRASVGFRAEKISFGDNPKNHENYEQFLKNASTYENLQSYFAQIPNYSESHYDVFHTQRKKASEWDEIHPYTPIFHRSLVEINQADWDKAYTEVREEDKKYYNDTIEASKTADYDFARMSCLSAGVRMDTFFQKNGVTYESGCDDFDVTFKTDYYEYITGRDVTCNDSNESYAVSCPYLDMYFCVDSTGFIDTTTKPLGLNELCAK